MKARLSVRESAVTAQGTQGIRRVCILSALPCADCTRDHGVPFAISTRSNAMTFPVAPRLPRSRHNRRDADLIKVQRRSFTGATEGCGILWALANHGDQRTRAQLADVRHGRGAEWRALSWRSDHGPRNDCKNRLRRAGQTQTRATFIPVQRTAKRANGHNAKGLTAKEAAPEMNLDSHRTRRLFPVVCAW